MQARTIPSMEREKWPHGNGERAIIVLYDEGLHGENAVANDRNANKGNKHGGAS